jgi:hypothetical protein
VSLTVDSGPLTQTCNSYASLGEMTTYVTDMVADASVADQWSDLDASVKAAYLVNASKRLDQLFDWIGERYSEAQGMKWPRYNACVDGYLLTSTIIPPAVRDAACEMAVWMMQNDGVISVGQSQAYSKIEVGPIQIDFNQNLATADRKYAPDNVPMMLRDYGSMKNPDLPGAKSIRVVRLVRA